MDRTFKKIKKPLEYPLNFDMSEYCNKPRMNLGKFNLVGVIVHLGTAMENGHYTVFTRRYNNKWWYCNDSNV